ncbi:MAG: hypothetical protein FWC78_04560 [Defluviitaleaceae bacterium]|nr:hypothetical protein [Defluviitaleaceae bacterium]
MAMIKSKIVTVLLWCLLAALLVVGLRGAAEISRFSNISLRFSQPICGQTAHRTRQYSIECNGYNQFWPTFWHEGSAEFSAGVRTVQASAISYSGNAALVWPGRYVAGSAPSSVDGNGVAVSEALAHSLWGSIDIVGMLVYVDDAPRIVRGVFEANGELALLSFHIEDTQQSWTAIELEGGTQHPTRSHAESFAIASGLGRPDYMLMGGVITLARFMPILPLIIAAIHLLVMLIGFMGKYYPAARMPVVFVGFILFAIAVPFLLNSLPPWIIPTHWSDFIFWQELLQQANAGLREFLGATPMLRDVELRLGLLKQAVVMVVALCVCVYICAKN